jgi:TonB family protein
MGRGTRIVLAVIALAIAGGAGYFIGLARPTTLGQTSTPPDNEELRRLHDEDQADRSPADGRTVDWSAVQARDRARQERIKVLFSQGQLRTANDYYHAAMILQHGVTPEDFLLAHEFCVVAISKGRTDKETRWLAASAEDRFLMNIGRPQRFGTQFRSDGGGPLKQYPVDTSVTNELRQLMGAHALDEAKTYEAELNKQPAAPVYSKADSDVRPPVEVDRRVPPWNPTSGRADTVEHRGAIEVVINEHGAVESATIIRPTVDAYDDALLGVVGSWRFKPASRNGEPVKYRTTFDVVLR